MSDTDRDRVGGAGSLQAESKMAEGVAGGSCLVAGEA